MQGDDDRVLGVLLLLIGGVRVVLAFVEHEVSRRIEIALFMVAMAVGLLLEEVTMFDLLFLALTLLLFLFSLALIRMFSRM